MTQLSLIIPCFNEEKRFQDGIKKFLAYFKDVNYKHEIVLVNDGSSDSTLKLMEEIAAKKKDIKITSYAKNRGKGFAISQGVKAAEGEYIIFADIDNSVPISSLDKFWRHFRNGADIVIASRRVKGAKFLKKQKITRELMGRGFSFLVRILIDWKIKDATCGFKAFRQKAAEDLFGRITVWGWAFDAELLWLAKIKGYKLEQAPVEWADVKGSKVSPLKDTLGSLTALIKIRLNNMRGIYR